jgi:hypothetical protein
VCFLKILHTELVTRYDSSLRGLGFGGHAQYHKIAEQILQILVPLDLISCEDECFPVVNVSIDHEHDWE